MRYLPIIAASLGAAFALLQPPDLPLGEFPLAAKILLPLSFLDPELFPVIQDKRIVVMCAIGKRSGAAQKQLAQFGRANVFNLAGGLDAWKKQGLETQGGKFEAMDYSI